MHLYLHIPFCRQACHYCDFHFSTNLSRKSLMVEAICEEIRLQHNFLSDKKLQTIYFGGGTPSLLSESEITLIFNTVTKYFSIENDAEITLEANPDDMPAGWKPLPLINRLSIGIQSFDQSHLQFLNRIHTANEAETSVKRAQDAGISNISIDLIYAIPAPNHSTWEQDLQKAIALQVPHISAYCLTIEPQTVFGKWLKTNKIAPIDDAFAAEQFQLLTDQLSANGLEQYEISNFAKEGWHSRHNSSYWMGEPYLGVGPSAHSFDGKNLRQFNVTNNTKYLQAIHNQQIPCEVEQLSNHDKANEYLLTSLRTKWGCSLAMFAQWGIDDFAQLKQREISAFRVQQWLYIENQTMYLTPAGKLFADKITSELFF